MGFVALPVSASETGSSSVSGGASGGSGGDDLFGQSFTVPNVAGDDFFHTLRLPRAVRTVAGGDGNDLFISAADANNFPTGPVLYQTVIPAGVMDGPVTFFPNITVTPGARYAWYIEIDSPTLVVGRSSTDTYPEGLAVFHEDGGSWNGTTAFDFAFLAQFSDGRGPTATALGCPATATVGVGLNCPVAVTSPNPMFPAAPTGSMGFSSVGGSGDFSGCGSLNASGQCTVTYTPSTAGSHTVFGQYLGNATYLGSAASDVVGVARRSTAQSATQCAPAAVNVGETVTCSTTVTDTDAGTDTSPTGSVAWQSSSAGSFSPSASCPLVPTPTTGVSQCAVVSFVPTAPGQHGITATYGGDATHEPTAAQAAGTVNVLAPAPAPAAPGPSAECAGLRAKAKRLKTQLRRADGPKKAKVRKKLARTRARLAALGC